MLEELNLPDTLSSVCILDNNCNDPIEPLYYSADFSPICVYCASEDLSNSQVTIIRCVLTVLVAGTPSRSEVVFYVV